MAASTKHPHPLVSYQPLRLAYQVTTISTVLLRLPYYAAISLVPSWRPHPTWTAKQTFVTRAFRPLLNMLSNIGITETLTLAPGKEGERFQKVPVFPLDIYKGPLAHSTVKPETIGGTWFPKAPGADITSKTVVLYFHGGAYISGDGRDAQCGNIAKRFLDTKGAAVDAVFSVQYRLSGYGGTNPFPAALQDALSSYLYLLNNLRIPAQQIVVGGDSAGANLATALLRYLHEFGSAIEVPNPKCALLFSSWVVPFEFGFATNPQRPTDFIPESFARWGAHALGGGPGKEAAGNPYIQQCGNPFATPVPLFVNAGAAELLCGWIVKWAEQMRGVAGNVVELNIEEGAVHDTWLVAEMMGFEESAWAVAAKVAEFVRRH